MEVGAGVGWDVEERDVVCEHDAGEGGREEHEGEVGEGAPFDHAAGACLLAWFAAEDEAGQQPKEEIDEADAADCPGEADAWLQLAKHDGEDDAADAGADGCAADCDGPFRGEVG